MQAASARLVGTSWEEIGGVSPSGGHARDLAVDRQLDSGIDLPVNTLIQVGAEERNCLGSSGPIILGSPGPPPKAGLP